MRVLLCGASDIEKVIYSFNKVVTKMGFEPNEYINGTIRATPLKDFSENSSEAVENANIIVFVLISQAGDITWDVEYETAVRLGKPYMILCEKELADHYFKIISDPYIKVSEEHRFNKATRVLNLLSNHQRPVIPFDLSKNDFEQVLSVQLVYEIERAVIKLQEFNKNRTLNLLIKDKSYKTLMFTNLNHKKVEYFENTLLDVFEHKEIRKRLIYFFTVQKSLSDDQIITLIDDPEQGVSREVVGKIPDLVGDKNDKEKIILALIGSLDNSTESGTIRRAVNSILSLDFKIGINYINKIPAYDIGTPRRILMWIDENFSSVSPYLLDVEMREKIINSINSRSDFKKNPKELSELSTMLLKRIDDEINKSKSNEAQNDQMIGS